MAVVVVGARMREKGEGVPGVLIFGVWIVILVLSTVKLDLLGWLNFFFGSLNGLFSCLGIVFLFKRFSFCLRIVFYVKKDVFLTLRHFYLYK